MSIQPAPSLPFPGGKRSRPFPNAARSRRRHAMLTRLAIRDVVLIEALELDFAGGLGALTGETGAGKSILLDALGLALGARADSGLVRHGAAQAVVTASFDAADDGVIAGLLAENALEGEPGEPLIVKRIVK